MVKTLRRSVAVLLGAGLLAGVFRLRGGGGVPQQEGGWRELAGPDLS